MKFQLRNMIVIHCCKNLPQLSHTVDAFWVVFYGWLGQLYLTVGPPKNKTCWIDPTRHRNSSAKKLTVQHVQNGCNRWASQEAIIKHFGYLWVKFHSAKPCFVWISYGFHMFSWSVQKFWVPLGSATRQPAMRHHRKCPDGRCRNTLGTAHHPAKKIDDGWPESEKDVFQAALSMVVVKDSRWIVGEFYWWILNELWKDMM